MNFFKEPSVPVSLTILVSKKNRQIWFFNKYFLESKNRQFQFFGEKKILDFKKKIKKKIIDFLVV
jgi:hypothetical protein